jgi:hypothetical protein
MLDRLDRLDKMDRLDWYYFSAMSPERDVGFFKVYGLKRYTGLRV